MAAEAQIRIRPLHDDETGPIDAVFEGMSPQRLVLVAEAVDRGRVASVGTGQLVATGDDVAEVAFAVVDRWQRRGVGRRLLRALRHRAMDLGCRVVVARVPVENRAAAGLLFSVFPDATMRRDGAVYQVVAALPEPVGPAALPLAV